MNLNTQTAKAIGYEGIDAALDSLTAMKRGPRSVVTQPAEGGK